MVHGDHRGNTSCPQPIDHEFGVVGRHPLSDLFIDAILLPTTTFHRAQRRVGGEVEFHDLAE